MRVANDLGMTIPTKLAFIHPIWFAALAVVAFGAPVFTMNADESAMAAVAVMTIWMLLIPLGWAHGIYRAARTALANTRTVGANRDWVFYVAEIGVVLAPILLLATDPLESSGGYMEGVFSVVTFVLVASYFASLWLASAALVASEEGTPRIEWHKAVGTFLLMTYWMFGAWLMQRRLKALRKAI